MSLKAIITDIEGTTSSLSFVQDVLFPYARERLPEFVARHAREPEVARLLTEAAELAGIAAEPASVSAQLLRWIDEDRKAAPLKALQGLIWEQGYASGDFTGHIYEDAVRGLRRWHDAGLRLYVYSSGSVLAQRLLFGHTAFGDLTPLFQGYFDTRIGGKRDVSSYEAIAAAIGEAPGSILFLSDSVPELDAAHAAGMSVVQLVRDVQTEQGRYPSARDFDSIEVQHLNA